MLRKANTISQAISNLTIKVKRGYGYKSVAERQREVDEAWKEFARKSRKRIDPVPENGN